MFSFLNNIPQVTKNILILNVLFFLASLVFEKQGVDLATLFGSHFFNSAFFEPFQVITSMFFHATFIHLFFNMFIFVMIGSSLEKLWGAKRFFIFVMAVGLGAVVFHNIFGVIELFNIKKQLVNLGYNIDSLDNQLKSIGGIRYNSKDQWIIDKYLMRSGTSGFGASGIVYGLLIAFGILFPNTEFYMYFLFPIKAKYLISFYFIFEVIQIFSHSATDFVGHVAHVGGAITAAIMVIYWRKTDKKNFW